MHVSTCTPHYYILGTAELIVLKVGFDNAIGVSVHVRHCTLHLFLGSWLEWGDSSFKVDDCGISRGNFQPTWHVQVTVRHFSCARSFIAHKALYWFQGIQNAMYLRKLIDWCSSHRYLESFQQITCLMMDNAIYVRSCVCSNFDPDLKSGYSRYWFPNG